MRAEIEANPRLEILEEAHEHRSLPMEIYRWMFFQRRCRSLSLPRTITDSTSLQAARQTMIDAGFQPDFPPAVETQMAALRRQPAVHANASVKDLRALLWSSIDNDTSRDLDQAEVAERLATGIRVLVAIADVDSGCSAGKQRSIKHAASETTSVYTSAFALFRCCLRSFRQA